MPTVLAAPTAPFFAIMKVRELVTKIKFATEKGKLRAVNVQVGKTKRALRAGAREARKFRREMRQLATAAKAAGAAIAGSRLIRLFTTDYSEPIDKIAKFAKATGVSIQYLQGLHYAAQLSGVSIEEADKALIMLGKRARDASVGLKKTQEAFAEIGVSVRDSNGRLKDQEVLLTELADRFKKMPNGTRKTALAMEFFGRTGAKLIPLLNEGSAGISRMRAEAARLGIVVPPEQAAQAEAFNDAMLRLKSVFAGLRNVLAQALIPSLTAMIERFAAWVKRGAHLRRMILALKKAVVVLTSALGVLIGIKIVKWMALAASAAGRAAVAVRTLGLSALAAQWPLAVVGAALAAVVLAVQDLWVFARGGDSLIGRILGDGEVADALRSALREAADALAGVWRDLKAPLAELWNAFKPLLPYLVKFAILLIKSQVVVWTFLMRKITEVIKALRWAGRMIAAMAYAVWRVAGAVRDGLGRALTRVLDAVRMLMAALARVGAYVRGTLASAMRTVVGIWTAAAVTVTRAWDAVVRVFVRLTGAIRSAFRPLLAMWDKVANIMDKVGGGRLGMVVRSMVSGTGGAVMARAQARIAPPTSTTRIDVGGIGVTVHSAPSMTPGELEERVRRATTDALSASYRRAMRSVSAVTP